MRPFRAIRAGQALSTFRAPPTSPSRRFSCLRRPVALTHNQPHSHVPPKTLFNPRPSHRQFSITPLITTAISSAETLLTTLHSATLTPWYLTIPLFALTLNLLTRLPAVIYSRRVAVRRAKLQMQPLARAWSERVKVELARDIKKEKAQAGKESTKQSQAKWERRWTMRYVKENTREIARRNKRWGVQKWKDWVPSLMVFPVWVVGIEALRRMCGGPRGLLGTLVFGPKKSPEGDGTVAPEASLGGGGVDVQEAMASSVSAAGGDASMATGGCLWFPDLMVADPYHILPLALSAILVMNLVPKSRVGLRVLLNMDNRPEATTGTSKWRLRMHRGLLVVATSAGFVTMDLPAALHLYWVTSAALTWAQTTIVWRLMPVPQPVPPAKKQERLLVPPPPKEPEKATTKKS
ncbi:hypothetical protein C8A03DRAFT_11642 [Achaetomium macrosporum]|uniref:Uncharacterized protein n=1 Tax=Achaetomium macrosporum TaxID=79813 RepID=A0AAN7CHH5_9PEZI|nr:hypothetical protein C8A03DRAFT_11642 [Achaetomium macrosporum]